MSPKHARCGQAEDRAQADAVSRRAAYSAHAALFGEPTAPRAGEIWTLSATAGAGNSELLLAIVTSVAELEVSVIPVSDQLDAATEWDLLIPASVLGYRTTAQAKLAGYAARNQLQERLSSLPAALMGELGELRHAAEDRLPLPPASLHVGPWVLSEDDQRLRARRRDAEALNSYLTLGDSQAAAEWGSFGEILLRGSLSQGVRIQTLADEPWAQRLQEGSADLFNEVPARRLARLMAELRIGWNEHVKSALENAVRATLAPAELAHGAALGRRRGASRRVKQSAPASPEEADRAAGKYAAEVEKTLKEL